MNHRVYVITVCRNAAALLEDTIKSVIGQEYDNLRYIVIDGASTDGTQDIIKRYADRIAYWVSEPDRGIYDAMNKGLDAARRLEQEHGDEESHKSWVNFMNAGDKFADTRVLFDVFSEPIADEVKVVGGATKRIYPDREEMIWAEDADVIIDGIPFTHQACIMCLGDWHFDTHYRIAADYHAIYGIYFKEGREAFHMTKRIIALYLMEGSTTFDNPLVAKKEYLKIQSKHRNMHWYKEVVKYVIATVLAWVGYTKKK